MKGRAASGCAADVDHMAVPSSPAAPDHPVTVVLPGTPGDPTIIDYRPAGLRFAVVTRTNISRLDDRWDSPGNYILLDPPRPDGTYDAYVGKAPMGLKSRLRNHVTGKQHWHRALLVVRDSYNGFHSAEVSWLEGRFYDHLHASAAVTLSNRQRPRDETLPQYERDVLEFAVDPVTRLLALIGHDIDMPPSPKSNEVQAPALPGSGVVFESPDAEHQTRRPANPTVAELLRDGVIQPGQMLYPPAGGRVSIPAYVNADGLIEWNGGVYRSFSGAGKAALGIQTLNGWTYWLVETPDGQRVTLSKHLRLLRQGSVASDASAKDAKGALHALLGRIPTGRWTTYGELAAALASHPRGLGSHMRNCADCPNPHRVLNGSGRVSEHFAWDDPNDTRDPKRMLISEGVVFVGDKADARQRLDSHGLRALV